VLPYVWRIDRRLSIAYATSTALAALLAPLMAVVLGAIVVGLQQSWSQSDDRLADLYRWLGLAGATGLVGYTAGAVRGYCRRRLTDEVQAGVERDLLRHAAGLDLERLEDSRVQAVFLRAAQNPAGHVMSGALGVLESAATLFQAAGLAAILLAVEPLWSLCLLLVSVPQLVSRWALARAKYRAHVAASEARRWTAYSAQVLTNPALAPSVKLLDLGRLFVGRCEERAARVNADARRIHRRHAAASVVSAAFSIGVLLWIMGAIGRRVLVGELHVGMFAAYWTAAWRLRSALNDLGESLSMVFDAEFVVAGLREFLQIQSGPAAGTRPHDGRPSRIELEGVTFTYPGASAPAVADVTLRIEPGETIAVMGQNGAGKTTLTKLLCRLYDPTAGRILIDGIDARQYDPAGLRNRFAYVAQHPMPFEASGHENIAYGEWTALAQSPEEVERIGREANVDAFLRRLPQGYQTHLGRLFGEHDLSGGQWQRISIARALARRSAVVVIMDEPAANLDVLTEERLYESIRERLRGKTAILITHRFSTVRMADRVLVMENGRVAEAGTHQELIARGGRYAEMYRSHMELLADPAALTGQRAA
jgi:ATP-binding cassette subfamily B protein